MTPIDWNSKDADRASEMASRLPEYLYKYTHLDGIYEQFAREVMLDSKLYFVSPTSFNDPLDCKTPPRFEADDAKLDSYFRDFVRTHRPNEVEQIDTIVKQMISRHRTDEGKAELSARLVKAVAGNGMHCLSAAPDSLLMWSYYARGHAGICFRFRVKTKKLFEIERNPILMEVKYADSFPNLNYYDAGTSELVESIVRTKANAWSHEREWRLIAQNHIGHLAFPPSLLDGAILGVRITPEHSRLIRRWNDARPYPIQILEAQVASRSYSMNIIVP